MAKYASTTTVAPENSRAEIERVLKRYGADGFQYATQGNRAGVAFTVNKIMVKISLTLPSEADDEIRLDRWGGVDYESRIKNRLDQALRQRWRALFLVVKAKLESVESGIETFEEAFMPHMVIPTGEHAGKTVGEIMLPTFTRALESGVMPKLLEMG